MWSVLFVVLAACITPDLVPCGDTPCPQGLVCANGDQCATSDQIASCDGVAELADCTADGVPGACRSGVMPRGRVRQRRARSRRGVRRRQSRLRRRIQQRLLEHLQDVRQRAGSTSARPAIAETTPRPQPAYCRSPNSDDPTAECDPVDGVRQPMRRWRRHRPRANATAVDDSGLRARRSATYTGSLTCTAGCTIDASACAETCGDGIIQADHGELCDGAPPVGGSCVEYGFDDGILGCSKQCVPDFQDDCVSYAWEMIMPGNFESGDANAFGVIGLSGGTATVQWGTTVTRDGGYQFPVASTKAVGAVSATELAMYDGSVWTATPLTNTATGASMLPDGTLVTVDSACEIELVGSTMSIPDAPATGCIILFGHVADRSLRDRRPRLHDEHAPALGRHELGHDRRAVAGDDRRRRDRRSR